jgi:hypothetical protein
MFKSLFHEKRLLNNVCSLIGYLLISGLLYKLGESTTLSIYIIILVCGIFCVRALIAFYCLIKFNVKKVDL